MTNNIKKTVGFTDTTLRDAHQSLLATRLRIEDMTPIAQQMDQMGFHSVEVWGGATFDTCMRFMNENPWERLRTLKALFKKTPLQMLLRGQNLVGYRHYADDVVDGFVQQAAVGGIDIFRIFDALNDVRNMVRAIDAVKFNGKHAQATISYTTGPIYDLGYYLKLGEQLKQAGADSICIKDMAGILEPYTAYDLVKGLKETIGLPIQMHTHYTSGMGAMMYLKAIEAGADVIDTANSALAMGTSQPATETMIAALQASGYQLDVQLAQVASVTPYFQDIRKKYHQFDVYQGGVDVNVLQYQVPGGMLSNFIAQLSEQQALDKLDEVLQEVPKVRADLGYPPLVTPSSQMVGTQAMLNVLMGERYKMVATEVKNYLKGQYGQPPGQIDEAIRQQIIGDEPVITVRPADVIALQLEEATQQYADIASDLETVLLCVLFPQVAKPFLKGEIQPETLVKASTPAVVAPEPAKAPETPAASAKSVTPVAPVQPLAVQGKKATASFASQLRTQRQRHLSFNFNGHIEQINIKIDKEGAAHLNVVDQENQGQCQ